MAQDYESMMRACHLACEAAPKYGLQDEVQIAKRVAALANARQYPDIVKTTGWLSPLVAVDELQDRLYADALLDPRALQAAELTHASDLARSNPVAHAVRLLAQAARAEAILGDAPPVDPEKIAQTVNAAARLWSIATDTAELYVGAPSPADVEAFLGGSSQA